MTTRDDIARAAREAGWSGLYTQWAEPTGRPDWKPVKESLTVPVTAEQVERFFRAAYDAGAAAEREACAKPRKGAGMNRENIIRMAQEAKFETANEWAQYPNGLVVKVERFAALVATAERNACLAEFTFGRTTAEIKNAIRARGNK